MVPSKNSITVIAVCGGSGSGKTTLSKALIQHFGIDQCLFIGQDSYYKDNLHLKEKEVNYDHPNAIDFDLFAKHLKELKEQKIVNIPSYDFATHSRIPIDQFVSPKPIIIIDGILVLAIPEMLKYIDYSIFLDIDSKTRYERRLARDIQDRGRTKECVHKQFSTQVQPMHEQFVEPSKEKANVVFKDNKSALEFIEKMAHQNHLGQVLFST